MGLICFHMFGVLGDDGWIYVSFCSKKFLFNLGGLLTFDRYQTSIVMSLYSFVSSHRRRKHIIFNHNFDLTILHDVSIP